MYKQGLREELILAFFSHGLGFLLGEDRSGHMVPPGLGVGRGREFCNPLGKIVFSLKKKMSPLYLRVRDSFECCINSCDNFIFPCY